MADIVPNVVVSQPSQIFTLARSFKANANGRIYIGKIDTDPTIPENQIQVYLENEDGSLVPMAQPIMINAGGYPVYGGQIAKFVTVEGHSMAVYDAYGVQQFYFPNVLKYDPDQFASRLKEPYGAGYISNVYNHYDTTSEIKSIQVSALTNAIHTRKYQASSTALSENVLLRDAAEDSVAKAGTDWKTNGVINGKALVFDNKGKAFRLMPTYGYVTIEGLGGGEGTDDAFLMDIAQQVSSAPVRVVPNKTYMFSRPVKHSAGCGWIGRNTTFIGPSTGNRVPFISSINTSTGANNDTVNGTSGVNNVRVEGIIIDTNYLDATGALGFSFAENTLDNWTDCIFENVTFKNSKFDNLALQNNCARVYFHRCIFEHAGEDAVTLRKTCENIGFFESVVSNTAQVAKNGVSFGDGIVVKAKFVIIDGCRFINVGNHIKGAGIANNAEDVDSVFQASYGTFINNRFDNCYGGVGIGTMNQDFIAAGLLIEGITLDNNTYINTDANAVGIRYVRDLNHGKCKVIAQKLTGYYAIELINVVNMNGEFDVRTANGGAMTITRCTGRTSLTAFDVSKEHGLNGITIADCDGLIVDAKVDTCNRNGVDVNNFNNGKFDFVGKNINGQGAFFGSIRRSSANIHLTSCGENGVAINSSNDSTIDVSAYDCGTATNDTYASLRIVQGSRNRIRLISASGQANKPKYDMIVEGSVAGTSLYYIVSAGVTAKTLISPSASVTKIEAIE
ncbi:phage head-binding domain-containing protein [Serratia sp. MF2]|uniref:phage head-binding domain-containing protein n=1 Tax=Serratia sp. MF2 TaxID=3059173 RepID=UPI0027E76C6B|nr:phage head-binding domain-containing protein [Serratia sp. MF2]MDQ7100883.1 phage head-binding domain-containing protein [Serratia sp. MF2]